MLERGSQDSSDWCRSDDVDNGLVQASGKDWLLQNVTRIAPMCVMQLSAHMADCQWNIIERISAEDSDTGR